MPIASSLKVIESWHRTANRILPPNGGFIVCPDRVIHPERSKSMSPHLNREERAELKAHHLACSHLIKGCQDGTIRLRRDHASELRVAGQHQGIEYRAVEILEDVLGSWCETLSVLRANLNQSSPGDMAAWQRPAHEPSVFSEEMISTIGPSAERPSL